MGSLQSEWLLCCGGTELLAPAIIESVDRRAQRIAIIALCTGSASLPQLHVHSLPASSSRLLLPAAPPHTAALPMAQA